jgi:hypothetical protein
MANKRHLVSTVDLSHSTVNSNTLICPYFMCTLCVCACVCARARALNVKSLMLSSLFYVTLIKAQLAGKLSGVY